MPLAVSISKIFNNRLSPFSSLPSTCTWPPTTALCINHPQRCPRWMQIYLTITRVRFTRKRKRRKKIRRSHRLWGNKYCSVWIPYFVAISYKIWFRPKKKITAVVPPNPERKKWVLFSAIILFLFFVKKLHFFQTARRKTKARTEA